MSDDRSRRGLNPNAQAFVPNPGARPFVPGQPYMFATPPPMYGQPPPPFPVYQQPPQMMPAHMMQQARMPMHVPPQMQMHYQQVPPQQHHPVRMLQQQPPLDAWDAEEPEPEAPAPMETHPEPAVAEPVKQEESEPPEQETEPERETEAIRKSDESSATGDKASPAPDSGAEGKIEEEDEVAALPTKFKRSVYVDDGTRKEHVNIVFIGHVDAGKSTIGGQLMYLTGMVDKRTLEKYEKEAKDKGRESWYLSWALDTNDEEREKGKTVECGRAFFETEKKHFTILDAPGHKSFVPNMISGATQADLAVLVISARKGEFETGFDRGGQTREHAMLVKTAGVRHMIVLVNKMDDPTVNWDEERFKEIQNKLTPYLRKCGYNPKSDIFYIPVSGLTGAFLKDRPSAEFGPWYTYYAFVECSQLCLRYGHEIDLVKARLCCLSRFSLQDMGTIIIGKIESGVIAKGDMVTVMPNRTSVQVIQLWSDDAEVEKIMSGDNVKLKLKGVEDADILPGFILCSPDALCHVGKVFDAEVVILEHRSIIASGYSCVLHIQSAIEEVTVKMVICTIDKKTGAKVRARFVKQDEKCIMRLESAEAFCLEAFKDFPQMGRFTLRDEGRTIAIGKVLKVVE
uniref:Tr-type G domain-containing protein n=1 Tax=Ascaris lumbricoides TaxID=6252 RepID=A0A0M3HV06_ASCLU